MTPAEVMRSLCRRVSATLAQSAHVGEQPCGVRLGRLSEQRAARLQALAGFEWNVKAAVWDEKFAALVSALGDGEGLLDLRTRDPESAAWLMTQCYQHRAGRLSARSTGRLQDAGIDLAAPFGQPIGVRTSAP